MPSFTLIVPTYNAGSARWNEWFHAFQKQTNQPSQLIIIDSSSTDDTRNIASTYTNNIIVISPSEFNHGGTRNKALASAEESDFVVFLTQDAIFENKNALEEILSLFNDKNVAAVCGRQLPHHDANPLAIHA
ncbi:glycosyltransferase family 2 protein, partial [Salmonella enterica]|nr:glycosyltransferase family 2 protein [Salmonella enterica]